MPGKSLIVRAFRPFLCPAPVPPRSFQFTRPSEFFPTYPYLNRHFFSLVTAFGPVFFAVRKGLSAKNPQPVLYFFPLAVFFSLCAVSRTNFLGPQLMVSQRSPLSLQVASPSQGGFFFDLLSKGFIENYSAIRGSFLSPRTSRSDHV